jgi:drug/metabolite transporter (DMT)-like permease
MSAPPTVAGGRRLRADLALVGNTIAWGCTFVVVKETIRGVSPLLFLAMRFSIATIALVLLFPSALRPAQNGRRAVPLRAGLLAGFFLFSGYAFQTFGLRLTSAAKSAFITGLSIALVPLVGALVYRIRPRFFEVAGVCCATAGLGFLTLQGTALDISRGDLITLCCALCYAAHIVTVGHYAPTVAFESLAVIQVATAAFLSLASFWWFEPPVVHWSTRMIVATLFAGLVATAAAFTVQAWAQQYTTATRTAVIYALEPVFAWITSFVVLGEGLTGRMAIGAVLILAGILLVELKPALLEGHP